MISQLYGLRVAPVRQSVSCDWNLKIGYIALSHILLYVRVLGVKASVENSSSLYVMIWAFDKQKQKQTTTQLVSTSPVGLRSKNLVKTVTE